MSEMLSGADMLVRALQDEGVEYLFGYPGGAALHIYDAIFKQQKVEHILVRHEQAATHMADGYARATGKPGVVLVTSGPGADQCHHRHRHRLHGLNLRWWSFPARCRPRRSAPTPFRRPDMVGVSRPVVKHSFLVRDCAEIPRMIKTALPHRHHGAARPGGHRRAQGHHGSGRHGALQLPRVRQLAFLQARQTGQRAPIAQGGEGVDRSRAAHHLQRRRRGAGRCGPGANSACAPARGTGHQHPDGGWVPFPGDDPQFIGMLGMHGTYEANMAMHHADVIFAVGARFDDRVTNNPDKFCPNARIVHVDVDPASISKIISADLPHRRRCVERA